MRLVTLSTSSSLLLLTGFVGAQNGCPGICLEAGEQLLNPQQPIFLDSGNQFCATLNDQARQLGNNAAACLDASISAIAQGCKCGAPTEAPSQAPSSPGAPTGVPGTEPCLGVCPGGTLLNPNQIVTIPGRTPDFCFQLDRTLKELVGDPTQCDQVSIDARINGCDCDGVPTFDPTTSPTITRMPTSRPSVKPTGTPTGSPKPTRTEMPTKLPTTPNPTGTPTTPKPTGEPGFCSGVCLEAGQTVADPDFVIITNNAIGGGGVITETCAEADARFQQIFAPGGTCERFSLTARNNGCQCVEAVDCSGICNSGQVTPKIGQSIVTPDLLVDIGGRQDTCANWDAKWDAISSPTLCQQVPNQIALALQAGCRCDIPVECPGLCPGEQVTTPNLEITLSNGVTATCFQLDAEFSNTIDPQRCNEFTNFQQEIFDQGCRCGTPIVCEGLCTGEKEVLLTPELIVDVPSGEVATCATLDLEVRQFFDQGLCTDGINAALDAGCRCGAPIKCKGICPDKERKLFDKKAEITVPWTGEVEECDKVDKEVKEIIDAILCDERSTQANRAGCQCGATSESPSMMPSLSVAPTVTASSNPTNLPTVTPPTVAPNVPLSPTGGGDGTPTTNQGPTTDGGDGGGASQAGNESGSCYVKQVWTMASIMMMTAAVVLVL